MKEKEPEERYTDAECTGLFAALFPHGLAGEDVLAQIAPEGYPQSTLRFAFHPTVDQVYWERVQVHRSLQECPGETKSVRENLSRRWKMRAELKKYPRRGDRRFPKTSRYRQSSSSIKMSTERFPTGWPPWEFDKGDDS